MPRPRRHPVRVEAPPVDGAEVAVFFRKATKRGPYPTSEACAHVAEQLNAHLGYADLLRQRIEDDKRTAEAARVLLYVANRQLEIFDTPGRLKELPQPDKLLTGDEYDILYENRAALVELSAVLAPLGFRLQPERAAWFASVPDCDRRLGRLRRYLTQPALTVETGHRTHTPIWDDAGIICWLIAKQTCETRSHSRLHARNRRGRPGHSVCPEDRLAECDCESTRSPARKTRPEITRHFRTRCIWSE